MQPPRPEPVRGGSIFEPLPRGALFGSVMPGRAERNRRGFPVRLRWTYTALHREMDRNDIIGRDPGHPRAYCRVHRAHGGSPAGKFMWAASDGNVDLGTGYAQTLGAAAKAAEAAYFGRAKN